MLYVHAVPGPAMIDLPQRLNRSASRCSDVLVEGTIIYLIVVASRVETSGFEAASVECGIVVRPPDGAWHLPFCMSFISLPTFLYHRAAVFLLFRSSRLLGVARSSRVLSFGQSAFGFRVVSPPSRFLDLLIHASALHPLPPATSSSSAFLLRSSSALHV